MSEVVGEEDIFIANIRIRIRGFTEGIQIHPIVNIDITNIAVIY